MRCNIRHGCSALLGLYVRYVAELRFLGEYYIFTTKNGHGLVAEELLGNGANLSVWNLDKAFGRTDINIYIPEITETKQHFTTRQGPVKRDNILICQERIPRDSLQASRKAARLLVMKDDRNSIPY